MAEKSEERFIPAIADMRRVCCCICPVNHRTTRGICALFIEQGETLVLARYGDNHYAARCVPCAKASGYRDKPTPAVASP
jgi:hypothetical protein